MLARRCCAAHLSRGAARSLGACAAGGFSAGFTSVLTSPACSYATAASLMARAARLGTAWRPPFPPWRDLLAFLVTWRGSRASPQYSSPSHPPPSLSPPANRSQCLIMHTTPLERTKVGQTPPMGQISYHSSLSYQHSALSLERCIGVIPSTVIVLSNMKH